MENFVYFEEDYIESYNLALESSDDTVVVKALEEDSLFIVNELKKVAEKHTPKTLKLRGITNQYKRNQELPIFYDILYWWSIKKS